jgi:hypothetical protein
MATKENPSQMFEGVTAGVTGAIEQAQKQAGENWARCCDLYARYFAALAQARGAEGVFTANAGLLSGGLEEIGRITTSLQRLSDRSPPPPGA